MRDRLSGDEIEDIRTIAELRFASELSPEAFGDYVEADGRGIYELKRLPAEDDPQFFRTQRVREREHVFIETLNEHYADFYFNASGSYDGWREFAREEAIAVKELQRSSRWRTGMGIATIVASVLYGANSDGQFSDRMVRDSLMYMGMDLIKTARVRRFFLYGRYRSSSAAFVSQACSAAKSSSVSFPCFSIDATIDARRSSSSSK